MFLAQTNGPTDPLGKNIMLPTDFVLGFFVATAETAGAPVTGYANQICGPYSYGLATPSDPNSGSYGCTNGANGLGKNNSAPSTLNLVNKYFSDNQFFLNSFAVSFPKMVNVGYGVAPASGKLGSLTSIDLTKC